MDRSGADLPLTQTSRLLVVLPIVACALVLVVGALVLVRDLAAPEPPTSPPASSVAGPGAAVTSVGPQATATPARTSAREVLRRWDGRREAAWVAGDLGALRSLYTTGSPAGERDVSMLRRWVRRDARVEGWTTQVLALRVVRRAERLLVLRVTDRVSGATAQVGGPVGRRLTLPRDVSSTRRIELRRGAGAGAWRVASVRAA